MLSHFSHVWFFATQWTIAHQAPLSMGFSRQEYWSRLPFPSPEDLPDPGIEPGLLHCGQILYCLSYQGMPMVVIEMPNCYKNFIHLLSVSVSVNGTPLQYSCLESPMGRGAWWAAVHGVVKSQAWLSDFTFTFHFHALEKEMATHSSVLAWRIPGTGETGRLPSLGLHRVGHDLSDLAAAATIRGVNQMSSELKAEVLISIWMLKISNDPVRSSNFFRNPCFQVLSFSGLF